MYAGLKTTITENRAKSIERVVVIFPDNKVKVYNIDEIRDKITKRQLR